MFRKKHLALLVITLLGMLGSFVNPILAQTNTPDKCESLAVYFFYAHGCSYCEKARKFLIDLEQKYPQIQIMDYEIYLNAENRLTYERFINLIDSEPQGLPTIIIGKRIWAGFQAFYEEQIDAEIQICLQNGCENAGEPLGLIPEMSCQQKSQTTSISPEDHMIDTALVMDTMVFGKVNLYSASLLVSTLMISFVDGFNPCSLWILSVLLSLSLFSHSRKKTLLIGGFYLCITAVVYALFIMGMFSIISYLDYLKPIQIFVSLIAALFGLLNLKDYFFFKKGISLTISDQQKPEIFQKMRRVIFSSESVSALIFGTATLAVGVSLVEFSCTAGFPIVWSNLLAQKSVNHFTFFVLLLIYMFVYLLDEMVLFSTVLITMRASKIEEKHGRLLKLVSGCVMLLLAGTMLIKPDLLNNLMAAIFLFAFAFIVSIVIHFITQKVNSNIR